MPMSLYRRQPNGMWYGTSNPKYKYKFYLKNGIKMINFYNKSNEIYNIDDDDFDKMRDYVIKETLNAALNYKDKKTLYEIFYKYYNKYKYIFKEYNNDLSKIDKLKYIIKTKKYTKKLK